MSQQHTGFAVVRQKVRARPKRIAARCSIAAVSNQPAQLPMPRSDSGQWPRLQQRAGSFNALSVRLGSTVMISASCARVNATYSTRISSLNVCCGWPAPAAREAAFLNPWPPAAPQRRRPRRAAVNPAPARDVTLR